MPQFKKYKIDDAIDLIKDGYSPSVNEHLHYIGLEHIEQQTLRLAGTGKSSDVTSNKFRFKSGDVLFGKLRPYFRKVYRPKFDGVCSTDIWVARVKEDFDQGFIFYFMANEEFIDLSSQGSSGTRMPRADWNNLKNIEWEFPDLPTQTRIASILSSLDDKIELNRRTNHTLEQIAQTLFKKYFVNDIDLENLPEGWRCGKIGDVCENFDSKRIPLSSMQRDKRKGIYPYYGATSLMGFVDDYIFEGLHILLGEDGTVVDEKGFPVLQYVWGKFWVNNHAHVLKGKSYFSTNHLYMILLNTSIAHLVTGAVQPKINQGNLNNLEILIPDENTCLKFSKEIDSLFELKRNKIEETKSLEKIRDSLLPKLMSGEIEVNVVEKELVNQ